VAVQIQELEVVPAAPGPATTPGGQQPQAQPPAAAHPELELKLERAARLRRSRDLRLQAD
jgi:hypothetical protein